MTEKLQDAEQKNLLLEAFGEKPIDHTALDYAQAYAWAMKQVYEYGVRATNSTYLPPTEHGQAFRDGKDDKFEKIAPGAITRRKIANAIYRTVAQTTGQDFNDTATGPQVNNLSAEQLRALGKGLHDLLAAWKTNNSLVPGFTQTNISR